MAVFLPDIIGEYVNSPERYATDGVQFAGYFEPDTIAPEQIAHLFLFLQNTLGAPVTINFKVNMPHTGGLFRSGRPALTVQEPIFQLRLGPAEAGLLTLPVTPPPTVKKGEYSLTLELKVLVKGKPNRVRPGKSQSKLSKGFIDNPVGLNLVGTLGATYAEKPVKKASFSLAVAGKPTPPERAPRLKHTYQTIWVQDQLDLFNRAVRELNLREVKFKEELSTESLYAMLYAESTVRLADTGLPLRVGEAIILAKILTYSCQYFLSSPDRRNGLLVPIWERALEAELNTTDVIHVIRSVGYYHVLKLAIAISFGLIARTAGRQPWSAEERQAVANHIAESIEAGQELQVDFLYLPLLMAGALISNKLILDGEDPGQTLALLKQASEARAELFADAEMEQANKVFNLILKQGR
ncbi:MAG: hypothetical protein AB1801_12755 [Chloroflexota bacterium]